MIYFLIPVFNESGNMELLCSSLKSCLPGMEKFFVFVDDGSTDDTPGQLSNLLKEEKFVILSDGKNHGPGFSFNTGFEWILNASKNENDIVVTLEGDNTSNLQILENMILVSKAGFELVLASVYAQGGGFDKTSFMRKLLSSVANLFLRFLFNIKVQTLSSFYRVYTISLLKKIKAKYKVIIVEKGYLCMIEILLKSIRLEASILEVPMVLYSKKRKGKSKMKMLKTSFQYLRFMIKNRY